MSNQRPPNIPRLPAGTSNIPPYMTHEDAHAYNRTGGTVPVRGGMVHGMGVAEMERRAYQPVSYEEYAGGLMNTNPPPTSSTRGRQANGNTYEQSPGFGMTVRGYPTAQPKKKTPVQNIGYMAPHRRGVEVETQLAHGRYRLYLLRTTIRLHGPFHRHHHLRLFLRCMEGILLILRRRTSWTTTLFHHPMRLCFHRLRQPLLLR